MAFYFNFIYITFFFSNLKVVYLKGETYIQKANEVNRRGALALSLLLLDEIFNEQELLETYVGLSYLGT